MRDQSRFRFRGGDLVNIVVVGVLLGAVAGLVTATLGVALNVTVPIAAGTTGVIATILVKNSSFGT